MFRNAFCIVGNCANTDIINDVCNSITMQAYIILDKNDIQIVVKFNFFENMMFMTILKKY